MQLANSLVDPAAALHVLIEGVREGAAILSADWVILSCNRRLAEMLKLECDQVTGRPLLPFLTPDDQPRFAALAQSAPEDFQNLQVRLVGNNAFPLPAELAVRALWLNGTRVFSVLVTDLSRRRRAEEQLAFQSFLVRNVHDAIVAMDRDFRITFWNPAAERLTGWTSEAVLSRPAMDVLRLPLSKADAARSWLQLKSTGHLEKQVVYHRPDGTPVFVESTTTALRGDNGMLIGYVAVGRDITERKRSEDEIRHLNTQLEQRVAERTAELESANQELEAFAYSVSHDLRTPLASMGTFSLMLLHDYGAQLPEPARLNIHLIHENAAAMERLIQALLAFSRSTRQPLHRQPVATEALVRQVAEELRRAHSGREIELSIGPLPDCEADPILLRQVWTNLLSNAFKFTRDRQVARIEIGSWKLEVGNWKLETDPDSRPPGVQPPTSNFQPPTSSTVYFVRDNGVGFDMAQAQKLFGVFRRLHAEEEFEGTGVGLAIVDRIVRRHGGRVWAEAAVDQGATFFFTLGG
ncbi:MAG: PAS domain S-box protein [Chloroflexi bacterium]|nr:PAS domain S-box protein [Chloroflexota bacterium]